MSAATEALRALRPPVVLAGFGVEGRETLVFLLAQGLGGLAVYDRAFTAEAPPTEEFPGVAFYGDGEAEAVFANAGTVVRSPGLRPDHPLLRRAETAGARVTSAVALFLAAAPGRVVGVTGTLGKGTTVSLIEAGLRAGGVPCHVGGNIGVNPLGFLDGLGAGHVTVLELSSFQLMGLAGRLPEVAVVLRTSSEHLDWHTDVEEYRAAKRCLLVPPGAGQRVIWCADSEGARAVVAPWLGDPPRGAWAVSRQGPVADGIGVEGGRVFRYRSCAEPVPVPELERLSLPGAFNLENAAAALLALEAVGADSPDAREAIAAFRGLPHRLERVGEVRGVACYNDSYATRPDAALGAVQSFTEPLALILGGSEKHADFTALAEALVDHPSLRRIVLIGTTAQRLETAIRQAAARVGREPPPLLHAERLESAFAAALESMPPRGVLLFSPACASFDMFPNYKVRGERFRALVAASSD